jgi:D-alanyl-lipoteichoic acid acyltransferase DltB (MBOAT superfamily)
VEFATLPFGYFFLVALTGAWLLSFHRTARNAFLLLCSYYFAWRFQTLFLAALVVSSLVNFALAEAMHRAPRLKKPLLAAGIAANVGFLGFFKYWNFFLESIGDLAAWMGLDPHLPLLELIAPIGLSFYTFQQIAYLVDTYRGKAVRPGNLLDYLLFVAFFPRFAAGPIVRSHELLPQIMGPVPDRVPDVSRAMALIVTGLLKKMVLGTYLATHMVEDVFQMPSNGTTLELWIVLFAYTAQISLDFSGYTDIARGCALLMGFELPENFRYPYAATNIGEYWRRWHITFSQWLRDYIYFPLGGSRAGPWRTYLNFLVTFTICGLWHGPTWGFVLWGTCHGIALALHKAGKDRARARGLDPDAPKRWPSLVLGWAITLTFAALVRIFFKSEHLDTAWDYFAGLAGASGDAAGVGLEWGVVAVTVLTIALNFVGKPIFDGFVRLHERIPTAARPLAWVACALFLFTVRPYDVAFTIYFAF